MPCATSGPVKQPLARHHIRGAPTLSPILSVDDLGSMEFRRPTVESEFTVDWSSLSIASSSPSCDSLPEVNVFRPPPNLALNTCNDIAEDDKLSSAQKEKESQAEFSKEKEPDKNVDTGQPDNLLVLANWLCDSCPLELHCKLSARWVCMTLAFGMVCFARLRLKTFRPRLLLDE